MQPKPSSRKHSKLHPALKIAGLAALALLVFLVPAEVIAGTGGTDLPWNTPLQNLLDNMTGTTARILASVAVRPDLIYAAPSAAGNASRRKYTDHSCG